MNSLKKVTRFKESTRVTQQNAYDLLRRYAKDIPLEDLELIPRQHGGNVVFYYGKDKMLKVAKNGHRAALIKEAKLAEYLNTQQLPVTLAKSLLVHPKGFYAVFSRIDGSALTPESLAGFSADKLEAIIRSLGNFLSYLHNHPFPHEVLQYVPKATDPYAVQLKWVRRKIQFVKEHAAEFDIRGWQERLERLQDCLNQVWAVTHCDLSLGHLLAVQGNPEQLAVIDFADAQIHDPAFDLSELAIELYSDLPTDGTMATKIVELLLKHYKTDDPAVAEKIEFGLLEFEIGRAYQQVRNSVRQSTGARSA